MVKRTLLLISYWLTDISFLFTVVSNDILIFNIKLLLRLNGIWSIAMYNGLIDLNKLSNCTHSLKSFVFLTWYKQEEMLQLTLIQHPVIIKLFSPIGIFSYSFYDPRSNKSFSTFESSLFWRGFFITIVFWKCEFIRVILSCLNAGHRRIFITVITQNTSWIWFFFESPLDPIVFLQTLLASSQLKRCPILSD